MAHVSKAKDCACLLVSTLMTFALVGCGNGGSPTPSPTPSPTTTTTTLPQADNIWQWRSDMQMGPQITYDLSGKLQDHCLYGGCWRTPNVETLAGGQFVQYGPADKQCEEDNKTYCTYDSGSGITLFNLRNTSTKPGCLMRKTRLPVDLSTIGRVELDLKSSGSTGKAPWYAVWFAPMVYSDKDDNAKAAEIDLVENYDQNLRGQDVNNVNTNFAQCGIPPYTQPYCRSSSWGPVATQLKHHVTLKATVDKVDGRIINVYRCPEGLSTCPDSSPNAQIKVQKAAPPGTQDKWFPVWNKEVAKEHYGKYWLVADMWWTSATDFKLSVDNVKFFFDNDTEWKMDLSTGNPPKVSRCVTGITVKV